MKFNKNYLYKLESQNNGSTIYKLISHPVPSIILAYFFMVLVVICPLYEEQSGISINNLTYILVYIPCVSFFCFAVFFPLAYLFLNLPRFPYNLKSTLIFFFGVWISSQSLFHFVIMWIGIFPIPFEWIIIAFGVGVPLVYLIVWYSISKHIKSGKDTNDRTLTTEPSIQLVDQTMGEISKSKSKSSQLNDDIESQLQKIPLPKQHQQQPEFIEESSQVKSLSKSVSESLSKSIPKSLHTSVQCNNNDDDNNSKNEELGIPSRLSTEDEFDLTIDAGEIMSTNVDCNNKKENCGADSDSGSGGEYTSDDNGSGVNESSSKQIDMIELDFKNNLKKHGDDDFISATTPRNSSNTMNGYSVPLFSKGSFLYKFWIVISTMILGPFGYVFFHLFLFAFYSVSTNLFQMILIVSFQIIVFVYKLIFRLSFHRLRNNLPNIPLRTFQDGRVLFLFWLELSSHCFFSMVFPHVGSWYMILLYLALETVTLTLQIFVDTAIFRQTCIKWFERIYKYLYCVEYTGTMMYKILAQNGELDRVVSLELFFFNTVARALSGFAYIVFSLTIYYGPNQDYYPTIKELSEFNYFLTLLYAAASLSTALIHMYIFKRILQHIYKINLIKKGVQLWGRRPDVAFFFITNCFILPLVVLLQQNNAVSYLLTNLK